MEHYTGRIVLAAAGRDKNEWFFVTGVSGEYLLLADGKRRRAEHPKRKKPKHVQILDEIAFDHPTIGKLKQREPVSNRELRLALAAFKEGKPRGER